MLIFLIVGGYWFMSEKQENNKKIQSYQQELRKEKKARSETESKLDKLTNLYDSLYKEKNGSAYASLASTTKQLFSAVFEYHSDKEEDSIKARKQKASEFTNKAAVESLFPKDADLGTPSVTTISSLEKAPEIYLMPSDEKKLQALVVVHYSVAIAGSENQKGTFLYKVSFDPIAKQFTAIKNVGEVDVS